MKERIKKIAEIVIKQIDYLGANTITETSDGKISSVVVPDKTIFDKEEMEIIVPIVVATTKASNPMKLFIYAGYLLRRCEGKIFGREISKINKENIYNQSGVSVNIFSKETIKKITDWLDVSDTLDFGKNLNPFLYQEKEGIYSTFDYIMKRGNILKKLSNKLSNNENYEEVMNRNLTFGYCLRVAYEIFNSK